MNDNERTDIIVQGLDVIDIVRLISKRSRKYQAICLQEIEDVLDKESNEFKLVRKAVLDNTGELTRSIIRAIFGDVEYLLHDRK